MNAKRNGHYEPDAEEVERALAEDAQGEDPGDEQIVQVHGQAQTLAEQIGEEGGPVEITATMPSYEEEQEVMREWHRDNEHLYPQTFEQPVDRFDEEGRKH